MLKTSNKQAVTVPITVAAIYSYLYNIVLLCLYQYLYKGVIIPVLIQYCTYSITCTYNTNHIYNYSSTYIAIQYHTSTYTGT